MRRDDAIADSITTDEAEVDENEAHMARYNQDLEGTIVVQEVAYNVGSLYLLSEQTTNLDRANDIKYKIIVETIEEEPYQISTISI